MTITNGYITLAEFKSYNTARGQAASTDAPEDAVIEVLIEAVSRYIDVQSGRTFYKDASATVRYFTAHDSQYIDVDNFVSVTAIATDFDGSRTYSTIWSASDYDLTPDNAALQGKPYTRIYPTPTSVNFMPVGVRRGVKITAVWGWPSVPRDIWAACQEIVQGVNSMRNGQASSGKITVTAAGMVIRPEEVPPLAQKVIESYRPKT